MKYRWLVLIIGSGVLTTLSALASPDIQTAEGRDQERQRIAAERDANTKQFDAADRECKTRFIVTSCLDQVKIQRSQRDADLKRQENVLNELDRKAAAIKQQQKIEENTSDATLQDKEKNRQEALAAYEKKASERAGRAAQRSANALVPHEAKAEPSPASSSAQEKADKRAAYDQKQRDLIARRKRKRRDDNIHENEEKKKSRELEKANAAAATASSAKSPHSP